MNPTEDQREGYRYRNQAPPHNQHMRSPSGRAAPRDEMVERELARHAREPHRDIAGQVLRAQKDLPAPLPVERGRWSLQPHRVAVSYAECGEENRKCVTDERSVEMRQVARADYDEKGDSQSHERSPTGRLDCF